MATRRTVLGSIAATTALMAVSGEAAAVPFNFSRDAGCEIVFVAKDRGTSGIPELDHLRPKAGDVIEVGPIGTYWGREVHGVNDFFRIISLPNISPMLASILMNGEVSLVDKPFGHPDHGIIQHRGFHIAKANIHNIRHKHVHDYWDDYDRQKDRIVWDITPDEFKTIIAKRPPVKV